MTAPMYPIRAVAHMTGLSIDTLRAWDRRYEAVAPTRGDRGRVYTDADVDRLKKLAVLVQHGHAIGTVAGLSARADTPELFYGFTSFLTPASVYRYDFRTRRTSVFQQPHVAFDASRYETRQVFYTSRDGTRVPMFVTARKGIALGTVAWFGLQAEQDQPRHQGRHQSVSEKSPEARRSSSAT